MDENKTPDIQQQDLSEILQIRRDKLSALREAGHDPYKITRFDVTAHSAELKIKFEEAEKTAKEGDAPLSFRVAGRMMSRRIMGKASFCHISDRDGTLQLYVRRDDVGTDEYMDFKKWDIGDIMGVEGFAFRTQTGEISLHATKITLLTKSLLPLPEKFHGLRDQDLRYRQRYVDLIMNPDVKDVFIKRSKIITGIRNYLDGEDFLEVETPVLHNMAGGANARPFITHHNSLDIDMYLRIALELHLKRLIVGGLERVYEIGRVFRNEGMDTRHNPEFTMIEIYQAFTDVNGMMDLCENLIRYVAKTVLGKTEITYGDVNIDLGKPFTRLSMADAVKQYAGVDFTQVYDLDEARKLAHEHHIEYEQRHKIGDILNLFFDEYVEDKLVQPTFITGHPVEISPLAKKSPEDERYTERFELFVVGREHANAFSELNDPIDQRQRFEAQAALKAQGDEEACGVDEDFLCALEYGMPPTGGIGIGVDRLVMLLTDTANIRDVLLFPTMKPLSE